MEKMTIAALSEYLTKRFTELLELEQPIGPQEKLFSLGFNSAKATFMASELAGLLQQQVSPTVFYAYPSIGELAEYFVGKSKKAKRPAWSPDAALQEPVAIIGLSCRFPKGMGLEAYWKLLAQENHAIREIPSERWDVEAYYDANPLAEGKTHARHGAFLDYVDDFDPYFFDISPREAGEMAPDQKMCLELAWEAFVHAQIKVEDLRGTRTGVFIGNVWNDFAHLRIKKHAPINQHSAVGQSGNIIANRISYTFGFQGPSLVIDTACSSSLFAVHLACQALKDGDCDVALVGGVNVMLDPDSYVYLSKFGGLSATGRCHTFSANADGYVRGEGAGMVVLKPLSRAIQDGNRIFAVVRGSAVNNDGASNGLTAPNLEAQKEVLRLACQRSGFAPSDLQYVEAHGTGTKLGDPIEAEALATVYGEGRDERFPLLLGSVKTNIGHLEGAAGIASLIKVVIAMHEKLLPRSLNFDKPNPYIPFEEWKLQVVDRARPWKVEGGHTRKAGISSFGWGGTNAHIVLEEYAGQGTELLVASASTDHKLLGLLTQLKEELESDRYAGLRGVCSHYANSHALEQPHRIALKAHSLEELLQRVKDVISRDERSKYEIVSPLRGPKLVYALAPFGGQYVGMALELMKKDKFFREKMTLCDDLFRKIASWSLIEKLQALETQELDRVDLIIPLTFAIQASLHAQLQRYGLQPQAVIGHSIGEIAAVYIAGFLSLEDALTVAYHYGRLVQSTAGSYSMAVVGKPAVSLEHDLQDYPTVGIAGVNSSLSCNLAGPSEDVEALLKLLHNQGVKGVKINVSVPAHTKHIHVILEELEACLAHITPIASDTPFYSTSLGRFAGIDDIDGRYWGNSIGHTVWFAKGMEALLEQGYDSFLELGPHPVLKAYMTQEIGHQQKQAVVYHALERDKSEYMSVQNVLMLLYLQGADIRWASWYSKYIIPSKIKGTQSATEYNNVLILPISAKTEDVVREYAQIYLDHIEEKVGDAPQEIYDVCATAAHKQSTFDFRLAFTGKSKAEIAQELRDFLDNPHGRVYGNLLQGKKTAFVFSGQGGQWLGMGRHLYKEYDMVRETLDTCDKAFRKYTTGWTLLEQLHASEENSLLSHAHHVIQPMLFAMQISLARLWISWGIVPHSVVGHSMGEIAAAYISGAIRLDDAIRIICTRSALMQRLSGKGAMLAVEMSYEEAQSLCADRKGLELAVNNSPRSCVIGGDIGAIAQLEEEMVANGLFCRRVKVDVASHTFQMEAISQELGQALQAVTPQDGIYTIYSTVEGGVLPGHLLDSSYWLKNVRQHVRFAQTIELMAADGHALFLEIGPHPVLQQPIEEIVRHAGMSDRCLVVPSTRRGESEERQLLRHLGEVFSAGYPVPWKQVYRSAENFVTLPHYPWHRERYTIEDRSEEYATYSLKRNDGSVGHPFLAQYIELANQTGIDVWETRISLDALPFLKAYRAGKHHVLPVSVYIEMLEGAIDELYEKADYAGHDLRIHQPLVFKDGYSPVVQLKIRYVNEHLSRFEIFAANLKDKSHKRRHWELMADGAITISDEVVHFPSQPVRAWVARMEPSMKREDFYKFLTTMDFHYEPDYQCVSAIWNLGNRVVAEIVPSKRILGEQEKYKLHPIFLGSCIRTLLTIMPPEMFDQQERYRYYSDSIGSMHIINRNAYNAPLWVECELHSCDISRIDEDGATGNFTLYDSDGMVVARCERFQVKRKLKNQKEPHEYLHEVEWLPISLDAQAISSRQYLLFCQNKPMAQPLRQALSASGSRAITVAPGYVFQMKERGQALQFVINPFEPSHYAEVWKALASKDISIYDIVYAWAVEDWANVLLEGAACMEERMTLYEKGLFHLAQTVESNGTPLPIHIMTNSSIATEFGEKVSNLAGACVWAMAKGLRRKHAEQGFRCIDLPESLSTQNSTHLVQALHQDKWPDVAIRNEAVYAPTSSVCTPERLQQLGRVPIVPSVTSTSKGWHILYCSPAYYRLLNQLSIWLKDRGLTHLAIMHPTPLDTALAQRISQEWNSEDGAKLAFLHVDEPDEHLVETALQGLREKFPAIRGLLFFGSAEEASNTSNGRLLGHLWMLHQLLEEEELALCCFLSPSYSIWGAPDKGWENGIGGVMDSMAAYRAGKGLPGISVHWNMLDFPEEIWNKSETAHTQWMAIERVWNTPSAWWACSSVPLTHLSEARSELPAEDGGQRMSASLAELPLGSAPDETEAERHFRSLQDREQRIKWLEDTVKSAVAHIAKSNIKRINAQSTFKALGIDSLMLVQLKHLLEESLSLSISVSTFFSYPTINTYATHLYGSFEEKLPDDQTNTNPDTNIASQPADAVAWDKLSLEDLSQALDSALNDE